MNNNDLSLFCNLENNAFRLMVAADLILGRQYTKKDMSYTASNITKKCRCRSEIRERALAECLAVLETEPKNCLAHYIAGRAYVRTAGPSCKASEETLYDNATVHYERAMDCIKDGHEYKALIFLPADKRHDESLDLATKI